ncbi:uncharacterized protein LOC121856315 [Homarus americanus]|uniref:uncharacterized protein LOC121856315 n=1 Tax=Homarus americanus TaxID=6706 RepID=UPI001C48EB37|nr:uncharacterized protein LOC121856315 [Homarus americanus]
MKAAGPMPAPDMKAAEPMPSPAMKAAGPMPAPDMKAAEPMPSPAMKAAGPMPAPVMQVKEPMQAAVMMAEEPLAISILGEQSMPAVGMPAPVMMVGAPPSVSVMEVSSMPVNDLAVMSPTVTMRAASPEPILVADPPMPSMVIPYVGGQYRAQDEAGQYTFSHWGGPNTRMEVRDFLGRTSGSFAYINSEGGVEVRKYTAGGGSGFRVAASDLPLDTPEVAEIKAANARLLASISSTTKREETDMEYNFPMDKGNYPYSPNNHNNILSREDRNSLPEGPMAALVSSGNGPSLDLSRFFTADPSMNPTDLPSSYQAQNRAGQYAFHQSGGPYNRAEAKDCQGRTYGFFKYISPDGQVQTRVYLADSENGFRVSASDLP